MEQEIGAWPGQPWGSNPPPTPATATRAQRRSVKSAWSAWSSFRPSYTRKGGEIEAEINLKDRIWRGTGTGPTEADAAWAALQDCIDNWRADVSIDVSLKSLGDWLRRRR
jgi:hypothetical protein